MKYILTFILFLLLIMPSLNAVNPNNQIYLSGAEIEKKTFTIKEFVQSNNKQWASKVGKKLKWTEKIALNILRKKLKRTAKTNPSILDNTIQIEEAKFNVNDLALVAGLSSLSALVLGMSGIGFFALLSLIIAPLAVFIGLAGIASDKPRKNKAIWGLVIGLLISGLWIWAYTFF